MRMAAPVATFHTKAGIEEADVFVGNYDDDVALHVYYSENALQRNVTGTALMGAITAAVKLDGSINGAFSAGRRTADTSYGLA